MKPSPARIRGPITRQRWAFFFVLGTIWGVNVVFAPGAGTVYQVTVARDYRPSPYDGN